MAQGINDSTLIPTKYLQKAAQDIIRYDQCNEERSLLKEQLDLTQESLDIEKNKTSVLTQRNSDLEQLNYRCSENMKLSTEAFVQNDNDWQKRYNKSVRKGNWKGVQGFVVGVGAGILIGIFLIK